jgi:phosphoribosylanthranilate isomerase
MSVKVKICGITNLADARAAVEAGADALGFMFFEISARRVDAAAAKKIIKALPPFVSKAGVFVNPSEDFVRDVIAQTGIDTLQFHGEETPAFCQQFSLPVIKAFRMQDRQSLKQLAGYETAAWLLDTFVEGKAGGTGQQFNWDLAVEARALGRPIILAGGLTPANAKQAVAKVRPFGVDVSSGVEASPGKKDPAKIRAFIQSARST